MVKKRLKTLWRKVVTFLSFTAIFSTSLVFSGFIYANGIESFYKYDIPYISALEPTHIPDIINLDDYLIPTDSVSLNGNPVGDFGKPISLYAPAVNRRLEIVPAIKNNSVLLARPNNLHHLTQSKETTTNSLFYAKSSWRTISNPEDILTGSFLYVDTNREWRYVFMVEEVTQITPPSVYIIPENDNSQLVMMIEKQSGEIVAIRSSYRTILSIQQ